MNSLNIVFRTCSGIMAAHNKGNNTPRFPFPWFKDITKEEIIFRSLYSLIKSINKAIMKGEKEIALTIVDDHSYDSFLEKINKLLERCFCKSVVVSMEDTGQGASIGAAQKWALSNADEYVFFSEDDYLYDENVVLECMLSHSIFENRLGHEVALFPCDYPDNYRRPEFVNSPSYVAIGVIVIGELLQIQQILLLFLKIY